MTATEYFYDSYAVIEYLNGNKAYQPFFGSSISGALTKLNIAEIYYRLRRDHGPEMVANAVERFTTFLIDYEISDVYAAMELRIKLMPKNISYADAVGYHLAKKLKIPFLTGDMHFEGLAGVRFVK